MSESYRVLVMSPDDQRLVVRSLFDLRNRQIEKDGPIEDVDRLLLLTIDAPTKKERHRLDREAR